MTGRLGDRRFAVNLTADGDGEVRLTVPAGAVTDAVGRSNLNSETWSIVVDRTDPAPLLITTATSPTRDDQLSLIVNFGEPVSGFELSDLSLTGATTGEMTTLGSGVFLVSVLPDGDGQVTVSLPAGSARDAAANANRAAEPLTVVFDQTAPLPTLRSVISPTADTEFDVSIDFGEPVIGLTADDVTVTGGAISQWTDLGDGRATARVTSWADGPITVQLAAGAVSDAAGNFSLASEPLVTVVDTTSNLRQPLTRSTNPLPSLRDSTSKSTLANRSPASTPPT